MRLLAASGGPLFLLVVGLAATGGQAHHQQKNICELPEAVSSQKKPE